MRTITKVAAALVLAAAAGCSAEEEHPALGANAARETAKQFHDALVQGDLDVLVRLSGTPFRYQDETRVWPDAASLRANLAKEVPRVQHLVKDLDKIDAYSRKDLLAGKWPRARSLSEEESMARVRALGIEEDGWLVRVHADPKIGYQLVLNPEGTQRLRVVMLDL